MKKMLALILTTTLSLGTVGANVTLAATYPVNVILNGQKVTYPSDMPEPQIINDRTMIPSRHTAILLGFSASYDNATQTSTFRKGNTVIKHKMFTNVVNINGIDRTYEAASENQKDYMIMPIAMFLDAVDMPREWDEKTRTVTITSEDDASKVLRMSANKDLVRSGESVTVTVVASQNTTNIKLVEGTVPIATSTTSLTNNDGTKTFILTWTPTNTGTTAFRHITAVAGTSAGFSEETENKQNLSVIVEGVVDPAINTIELKDSSIVVGKDATVTVYTNSSVEKVRLTNDQNSNIEEVSKYTTSGNQRIFTVSTNLKKTGTVKLTVAAAGSDNKYSSTTKTTNVSVKTVSDYDSTDVVITNINVSPRVAAPNSTVKVTVTTTYAVSRVEITLDSTGERVRNMTSSTSSDKNANERTWEFTVTVPRNSHGDTIHYYANATGSNSEKDNERFSITSDEYASYADAEITKVDYNNSVRIGTNTTITVTTNYDTDEVEIRDKNNKLLRRSSSSSTQSASSNRKTWSLSVPIDLSGRNTYYVYAYDQNNYQDEYSISITGTTTGGSSNNNYGDFIKNVDWDHYDDVDYNETVYLTVETTDDVFEVWVEDPSGTPVATDWSPVKSGNRYIWELSFRANYKQSTGNVTYTVYATDDYDEDYDDISLYVYY